MTKYANKQHLIIEYVFLSFLPNASLESNKSQIPILIPIIIPSERCKSNVIVVYCINVYMQIDIYNGTKNQVPTTFYMKRFKLNRININ